MTKYIKPFFCFSLRLILLLLLLLLLILELSPNFQVSGGIFHRRHVRVKIEKLGRIKGRVVSGENGQKTNVFLGVPYAKPPLGKLRYRKPENPQSWGLRTLETLEYRSACLSNTSKTTSPQHVISEDCLYLNIFADDRCEERKEEHHRFHHHHHHHNHNHDREKDENTKDNSLCPVLFYIHGGGHNYDSPRMFPEGTLVDNFGSKQLIFVTVGYRLGSFGFLDFGYSNSDDILQRNIGFYDILKALEFVRKHIHNFGGNSNRVTLMGHSSGATSVALLALSRHPLPMQSFHQGIVMSGPPNIRANANVEQSFELAQKAGCLNTGRNDSVKSAENLNAIMNCLREKDALELIGIQRQLEDEKDIVFDGPTIDGPGGLFPDTVANMRTGRRPMPYMIGTTSNEFSFPIDVPRAILRSNEAFTIECQKMVFGENFTHTDKIVDSCIRHYKRADVGAPEVESEYTYLETFKEAVSVGAKNDSTVFLYSFDYPKRAGHAQDLTFVMGIHPFPYDRDDRALLALYPAYFANFARKSRPDLEWLPLGMDRYNYYSIDYRNDESGSHIRPENKDYYHFDTVNFWLNEAVKLDRFYDNLEDQQNVTQAIWPDYDNFEQNTSTNATIPLYNDTDFVEIVRKNALPMKFTKFDSMDTNKEWEKNRVKEAKSRVSSKKNDSAQFWIWPALGICTAALIITAVFVVNLVIKSRKNRLANANDKMILDNFGHEKSPLLGSGYFQLKPDYTEIKQVF